MPQASRGNRVALTIRLPFDEYREVAVRAKGRKWSMSDYVGYCVTKEISGQHKTRVSVKPSEHASATFRRFEGLDDVTDG